MTLIFEKVAPPEYMLKKSLFSPFQRKKTVSEELKTWYFPYSAFWLTGQYPHPALPPGYATGYIASNNIFAVNNNPLKDLSQRFLLCHENKPVVRIHGHLDSNSIICSNSISPT